MPILISHQKASSLCRQHLNGCKVPPHQEEYLIGRHGSKLGCNNGQYYVKVYGSPRARTDAQIALNL